MSVCESVHANEAPCHGCRGRKSNRTLRSIIDQLIDRYRQRLQRYGPHLTGPDRRGVNNYRTGTRQRARAVRQRPASPVKQRAVGSPFLPLLPIIFHFKSPNKIPQ